MRHQTIEHALARGGADSADAGAVALATVAAVRDLLDELRPLVGNLATQALYARSLHLARVDFQRPSPAELANVDTLTAGLARDLAARDATEAGRAGRALLHAFTDLLVSLIGDSLTFRMLGTAWGTTPPQPSPDEVPQ
jgi:hypothetical protein